MVDISLYSPGTFEWHLMVRKRNEEIYQKLENGRTVQQVATEYKLMPRTIMNIRKSLYVNPAEFLVDMRDEKLIKAYKDMSIAEFCYEVIHDRFYSGKIRDTLKQGYVDVNADTTGTIWKNVYKPVLTLKELKRASMDDIRTIRNISPRMLDVIFKVKKALVGVNL